MAPAGKEGWPVIYSGGPLEADIPDVDLASFTLHRAKELGDKPALVDGPSGRAVSYADLERSVRSLAAGLTAVSVWGCWAWNPAFPSEEPCMAVTCTNPPLLVLNSYRSSAHGSIVTGTPHRPPGSRIPAVPFLIS